MCSYFAKYKFCEKQGSQNREEGCESCSMENSPGGGLYADLPQVKKQLRKSGFQFSRQAFCIITVNTEKRISIQQAGRTLRSPSPENTFSGFWHRHRAQLHKYIINVYFYFIYKFTKIYLVLLTEKVSYYII